MNDYTDILYEVNEGVARITINRPEKYNAFRGKTCDEMIDALNKAAWDKSIGVVVLTGVGDKAFCTGDELLNARRQMKALHSQLHSRYMQRLG